MIVTSTHRIISSRRDIAVLQKESSAIEGEEDVNSQASERESTSAGLFYPSDNSGLCRPARRALRMQHMT
jgi:hypothetical protein